MSTDRDHDLPLFRWRPPECVVIPFPTTKRVGKIRRTVEVLSGKSGKGADHYFRQVIAGMRSQLETAGLPDEVIEDELRAFADAVFARIGASLRHDHGPPGAA